MCAGAIIWARIPHIVYGTSIADAVNQGRNRIKLSAEELFSRSKVNIRVERELLQKECAVLYNQAVREELTRLQGATDQLVRQIDPKLCFSRNYEKIRPYSPYCEERIEYRNK